MSSTASPVPGGVHRPLALLVAGAFFMEMLDGTIIATAAPSMARSFGVASADIGVAMTAYLLTLAVFIPLSGWLADRWGARPVFTAAIVVFTVASALCAAAVNLPMLAVMRVVQGVGGAMMVPVGRLVVLRSTEKAQLIRAIAYLTWPALAAPVVAPALGGLLSSYLSWHWIFLVNVPLGALALGFALRVVPDIRGGNGRRLDWPGFVFSALCLACVVYGAAVLSNQRIPVGRVAVLGAVALAAGVLAVWHLLRTGTPLLDLSVFRVATFRLAHASGSVFRIAINAVPFLLPLMFQDGFGWSPVKSGLAVVFVFFGNIGIKPFTTPLLRRFGFRPILVASGLAATLTIVGCALLTPGWPFGAMLVVLFASGVFRSLGFTAYNTIAFADVEADRMSHANTLASTVQQLATGLGVAVGALCLRLGQALPGVRPGDVVPYRVALGLVAALIFAGMVAALRMPGDAGEVIGGGAARRPVPAQRAPTRPAPAPRAGAEPTAGERLERSDRSE
ncbi:MFS transporter [Rugosimonospora africana]|uniref:MFS transporter n=1 Tax=Rugosimonospora africana TaxID=556532 RepID=UPI001EF19905|nr:MFS transporter [Rugosimonospora africana]